MKDPTTDYAKALALFSKLPKAKPVSPFDSLPVAKPAPLMDPAKDFRYRKEKQGMVSSIVDVQPRRQEWSSNALIGLINDNQAKTQDEIARQQRRVAAQGMVNSLGNVVKSLFSAYGASKGAPISPVKSTSQLDIARMDELWNQQVLMEQRANAEKLQLMLEDMRAGRADQQYWDRYERSQEDEGVRDTRNFEQQKTLFQLNEDKQKDAAELAFERNKILYGVKSAEQQALAEQKEAARLAELEKYGKFAPKNPSTAMTPQQKLDYEADKAKQKKYFSVGDTDLTEGQYNEYLTEIEGIQEGNTEPVLGKRGKPTGEVAYKDPRFKALDGIDLSTKIGQDKAMRTYVKILSSQEETPETPKGQPTSNTPAGKVKELSFEEFGNRLDQTMTDPIFKSSDPGGHVKQLTGIALRFKSKVPEFRNLSEAQIQEVVQAYYDKYYSKK